MVVIVIINVVKTAIPDTFSYIPIIIYNNSYKNFLIVIPGAYLIMRLGNYG